MFPNKVIAKQLAFFLKKKKLANDLIVFICEI